MANGITMRSLFIFHIFVPAAYLAEPFHFRLLVKLLWDQVKLSVIISLEKSGIISLLFANRYPVVSFLALAGESNIINYRYFSYKESLLSPISILLDVL